MSNDVMTHIDQVGSNAYAASLNDDGTANVEMTAARATKLQALLGDDNVSVVGLEGTHVIVSVNVDALAQAASEKKRTSRGSRVNTEIVSKMVYTIDHDETANEVTSAWWESDSASGEIVVNGEVFPIVADIAMNHYDIDPADTEAQPERTVYVVTLPTEDGELVLTSYGVTNLIRRVVSRNEVIG